MALNKISIRDLKLAGKKVFIRVDFNVPLKDGKITDDTRIRESLPTIKYALDNGAAIILASHLGRPKGKVVPEMSLRPVEVRLGELLGKNVIMAPDCIGDEVKRLAGSMKPGDVMLLENLRFYKDEEANEPVFSRQLASLADLYVNDAFGTSHRAHSSVEGITKFMSPAAAGFLMEKEIEFLGNAVTSPARPFVAILGGAKVSDKIGVIQNLLTMVDSLLIGGAMAYTLLKAKGINIGNSLVEEDKVELAKRIISIASENRKELLLPCDHVITAELKSGAGYSISEKDIPAGMKGVDIGPATVDAYSKIIMGAKTIVWNGPMGVFEIDEFSKGTFSIAKAIAESGATSIVGGGDSIAAVKRSGMESKFAHISTGGGASLEFLEGKELPGIVALTDKN